MLEPNAAGQQQTPQQTPSTNGAGNEEMPMDEFLGEMLSLRGDVPGVNDPEATDREKLMLQNQFRIDTELMMNRMEKGLSLIHI